MLPSHRNQSIDLRSTRGIMHGRTFIRTFCNFEQSNVLNDLSITLTKWVLLNHAPTSTQLHPPPPSSTQLHPPPPSSFQPPPALCNSQQYLNQSIARYWVISPNLGQKIKSCLFWLKTGTRGILEELILNPDLDFWNSYPKIHFWANLGPQIQSCLFCQKIDAHSISRMLIPNPVLDFKISTPKLIFWQIWAQKLKAVPYIWELVHIVSQGCWFRIET